MTPISEFDLRRLLENYERQARGLVQLGWIPIRHLNAYMNNHFSTRLPLNEKELIENLMHFKNLFEVEISGKGNIRVRLRRGCTIIPAEKQNAQTITPKNDLTQPETNNHCKKYKRSEIHIINQIARIRAFPNSNTSITKKRNFEIANIMQFVKGLERFGYLPKNEIHSKEQLHNATEKWIEDMGGINGIKWQKILTEAKLMSKSANTISLTLRSKLHHFNGSIDRYLIAKARNEQVKLRKLLINTEKETICCFCGKSLPPEFLHAAHILPRKYCSDEDKRKLSNIAVLACTLGCDKLFELGYFTVVPPGVIEKNLQKMNNCTPAIEEHLNRLHLQHCKKYNDENKLMFRRHHDLHSKP